MVGKFIKSFDDSCIYYNINKKGNKFLIFLHGWPLNYTVWKKELGYFKKRGYSTIAPDLRGHGKSDKPERLQDYTFDKFAKDIDIIAKKERAKDFVLIGHSFGGMIALAYYSLFPQKVKALILLDTIYENPLKHLPLIKHLHLTSFTENFLKFILNNTKIKKKHFPYIDFSKFKDHNDFFYWLKGAEVTPLKSNLACLEEVIEFNQRRVLSKINIPTLIIEGSKDYKTPLDEVKKMAEKIKKAKLKIISGTGHDTNIRRSGEVEKIIFEFLNEINYIFEYK